METNLTLDSPLNEILEAIQNRKINYRMIENWISHKRLSLQDIKDRKQKGYENFINLPTDEEDYRVEENLNLGEYINKGFEGKVYNYKYQGIDTVIKLIEIKDRLNENLIKKIVYSYYASNIKVGPKIYDTFITKIDENGISKNYLACVMDILIPLDININNGSLIGMLDENKKNMYTNNLIKLYKQCIDNSFLPFDNDIMSANNSGLKLNFIDFSVSYIYESSDYALKDMFFNDTFLNYPKSVENYFMYYYPKNVDEYFSEINSDEKAIGGKKKIKKTRKRKMKMKKRKTRTNKRKKR